MKKYFFRLVICIALISWFFGDIAPAYAGSTGTYAVTYNANASYGISGTVPVDSTFYSLSDSATVLDSGSLTRAGYMFSSWNTLANGSGITYLPGSTITMTANITLYAIWSPIAVTLAGKTLPEGSLSTPYTADIDPAGGGSGTFGYEASMGLPDGLSFHGTTISGTPTVTGTFSFDVTATDSYNGLSATATYSITINDDVSATTAAPASGGVENGDNVTLSTATEGASIYYTTNGDTPTTSSTLYSTPIAVSDGETIKAIAVLGSISSVESSFTYNINTHTVTYSGNGSTGGTVPVDGGIYVKGAAVTVLGNTGSLEKSGYIFSGWRYGSDTYHAGDTFSMDTADVTLTAVWASNTSGGGSSSGHEVSYTLSYDGNGSAGGAAPAAMRCTAGAAAMVSGNTGSLEKSGYTFSGWNTKADGSGTSYVSGSTFSMNSGNITLYAQWTPKSIVYDESVWRTLSDNVYNVAYSVTDGKKTIVPTSCYYASKAAILYKTPESGSFEAENNFVGFSDISSSYWASKYIWFLSARAVVTGMENDRYVPEGSLTRAQFIKMLACMTPGIDFKAAASTGFNDVAADDWFSCYVNWGAANKLVFGYKDGRFGPDDPITHEEMCCIIVRYCNYLGFELGEINNSKKFADQTKISAWAIDAVDALQKSGLITGSDDNTFDSQAYSTRAQAAAISCKLLMGILDAMENPSSISCN